jgi:uncharacterized protein (DUF169 family)
MNSEKQITELLGLRKTPVAVKFDTKAPTGVARIDKSELAGCGYWKLAAAGQTFYTVAEDHYGCPIGSHTHGIKLPADKAKELDGLVGTMVQLEYLNMDEVPNIPQCQAPFEIAIYAPLSKANFEADVVLVLGTPKQMMLLAEAAHAAGILSEGSVVGRPTCAAIPAVMQSGNSATNLGCIGNRVYTEMADDELYFAFAGSQLDAIVEKLNTIVNANRELEQFHLARVSV